jgi:hypothetical protein
MKIECFFSEGCRSKKQLMQHIERALCEEGMGGYAAHDGEVNREDGKRK